MICQATIDAHGFLATDIAAHWCDQEAVTTVRLAVVDFRAGHQPFHANVWLCAEHVKRYEDSIDL